MPKNERNFVVENQASFDFHRTNSANLNLSSCSVSQISALCFFHFLRNQTDNKTTLSSAKHTPLHRMQTFSKQNHRERSTKQENERNLVVENRAPFDVHRKK